MKKVQSRQTPSSFRQKALSDKRTRRARRVRARVKTYDIPRLSVFRSNSGIYAQIIDDIKGITLCSAKGKLKESALVGERIAADAAKKKISRVTYDRGRYLYHGHVKALAEGARKKGLKF